MNSITRNKIPVVPVHRKRYEIGGKSLSMPMLAYDFDSECCFYKDCTYSMGALKCFDPLGCRDR